MSIKRKCHIQRQQQRTPGAGQARRNSIKIALTGAFCVK